MIFLRQGFRKLSSDIHYRQTDRQTRQDKTDRIDHNYKPLRFAGGQKLLWA